MEEPLWTTRKRTEPVDLGDEVWLVDTRMGGYDGITAGYLIRGERPCLVETGRPRSADEVVRALAGLGVGPDDLATIVVTHIHLDHAGGVGDLAAAFPRAEVVVHEAGARHLADPSASWPAPPGCSDRCSTSCSGACGPPTPSASAC